VDNFTDGSVSRNSVARLNPDGTLDKSFDAGDGTLDSSGNAWAPAGMVVLPDGKILLGGRFFSFDGVPRPGLVRLYGDLPPQLVGITSGTSGVQVMVGSLASRIYVLERSDDLLYGGGFPSGPIPPPVSS